MNVIIICVNYNSYDSLKDYLLSLENAVCFCEAVVSVYVADNSISKQEIDVAQYKHIRVIIKQYDNLGYLGGAFAVFNSLETSVKEEYDYCIVSNVDVTVNNDFFQELKKVEKNDQIAWIAPAIYKERLKKIGVSELSTRPSLKRMQMYSYVYSHPTVYKCFLFLAMMRRRIGHNFTTSTKKIYAGYGSFMIFTKRFMNLYAEWDYPPFLYGEEIFFAEIARQHKMMVLYLPNVLINDIGQVSTGRIGNKPKLKIMKESNDYLYNKFFKH